MPASPCENAASASLLDATAALPQKWDPDGAASLPFIFDGRCRADYAFDAPFVPNGRDGAPPPSQDSGAKRRPWSVDGLGSWFANSNASFRQGRLPPQIWAPTEHRPPSLDWRCRADYAQGAAGSFANGGTTFALLAPCSHPARTLLAPCSLRPSGHLRCASSAPPGASVVSSQASAAKRRLRVGKPSTANGSLDRINKINGIQLSDSRQGEGKSSGQIKCFLTYA